MNVRAAAAHSIVDVIQNGCSLSNVDVPVKMSERDRSLLQAICYGVCRWYFRLDAIAKCLLDKPLKQKDQDIYILILIGLYQLTEMRVPDYAAVGETVAATKELNKLWAKNLVNGVLRQYQRSAAEINEKLSNNYVAKFSHPEWLIDKIKRDWPSDWKSILEQNNQHPPFALRINQHFNSREHYLASLPFENTLIPETLAGIILDKAVDVLELPGFNAGHISVQDGAAQLAATLLMLEPGQRVLDACAAPGGKTAHMLEMQPGIAELIAVDHDEERLHVVEDNLQRLQLNATLVCADASDIHAWWDGKLFDRILLDAPCSASGVIRRHPDIKLLRRASDIPVLAEEQNQLLNSLWQTLKSGGILLYATCSIFHEENDMVLKEFLASHPDAQEEKILADWGKECAVGRQILPGMHNMDGFYYARLRKS